jgi:hypothetical protein
MLVWILMLVRKLKNESSMTKIKVYFDGLRHDSPLLQDRSALNNLLTLGQSRLTNANTATQSLQSLLCNDCGLNVSSDCPIAALTHFGEFDTSIDATTYWLLATPVHLTLQRDFFSMTEALVLSNADSLSLIAHLNAHFADNGYEFSVTPSLQWLLKVQNKRELLSTTISQVIGRDTRPYMPNGADAAWAAQLTNEIQMLLFEHPINQAREARGELAMNSIWLSGTGTLPEMPNTKANKSIYADDAFAKGLAKQSQLPLFALPPSIDQLLAHIKMRKQNTAETILWLDRAKTQHDWFTEILQLLSKGKLKQIILYFELSGKVLELTLSHWDTWIFWRKCKPIADYF